MPDDPLRTVLTWYEQRVCMATSIEMSMPGIKQRIAWTLVAEIVPDVQAFPSPAHIAS